MTSSFHSDNDAFLSAFIAVLLISFIPFVILFLLFQCRPHSNTSTALLSDSALRIFVSFAVGGLLGDAFLHLIPHALNPHSHDDTGVTSSPLVQYLTSLLPTLHNATATTPPFSASSSHSHSHTHEHEHEHEHSHGGGEDESGMRAGLLVLAGVGLFFVVEKVARMRAGPDADEHAGHSHSHGGRAPANTNEHSHSHARSAGVAEDSNRNNHDMQGAAEQEGVEAEGPAAAVLKRRRGKDGHQRSSLSPSKSPSPPTTRRARSTSRTTTTAASSEDTSHVALTHITSPPKVNSSHTGTLLGSTQSPQAALTGLLNLLADLSHNFTDGLAITASFLSSPALGVSTALAVLVHEVPHELGDFAILLQAGFTLQQAMWMQLVTAIGAVVGVAVMWLSGGRGEGVAWVLPVTAGGFVYVALVNVVPSLLKEQKDADRPVGVWRWVQLAAEMGAMLVGVGLMVALGEME